MDDGFFKVSRMTRKLFSLTLLQRAEMISEDHKIFSYDIIHSPSSRIWGPPPSVVGGSRAQSRIYFGVSWAYRSPCGGGAGSYMALSGTAGQSPVSGTGKKYHTSGDGGRYSTAFAAPFAAG